MAILSCIWEKKIAHNVVLCLQIYTIKKIVLFLFLIIPLILFSQKKYQKTYYKNKNIKEEGWVFNTQKTGYWKFYYKNGNIKKEGRFKDNLEDNYWYFYRENKWIEKEGHFNNGEKSNWWLFYNKLGFIEHKCQLKNNLKNGFCLIYKEHKLIKASKFKNGKRLKEWTDYSSFKKENRLNDLR